MLDLQRQGLRVAAVSDSDVALRSLSLCSGIGGLDLGLERCGAARAVCYLEREAFAAAALVAAMERGALAPAPVWSGLRSFDPRPWRGRVDLVVAGYPCQPYSHAGRRLGHRDPRDLWPQVCRILVACEAPLLFCENVAGHLSLGLARVLADLAALGFDVEWDLFRASDVGAPHPRERLFFLAYRDRGRQLVDLQLHGDATQDAAERDPHGRHADGCGEDVADALRERRQQDTRRSSGDEGANEGRTEENRDELTGDSADVADAEHLGHDRSGHSPPRADRRSATDVDTTGQGNLGDSERAGLEERRSDAVARSFPAPWPPSPADAEGWRRWLADGGPAPVGPRVRRGSHGAAERLDRLRALGNAVVPAQAALAWRVLIERALR